jgi:hypothetical protein
MTSVIANNAMNVIVTEFVDEINKFSTKLSNILVYKYLNIEDETSNAVETVFVDQSDDEYNNAFNALSDAAKTFVRLHFDNHYWGQSMTGNYISVNSAVTTLQTCDDEDVRKTTLKQLEHLVLCLVIYGNLNKFPTNMTFFGHDPVTSDCDLDVFQSNYNFMRVALTKKHRQVYSHLFSS